MDEEARIEQVGAVQAAQRDIPAAKDELAFDVYVESGATFLLSNDTKPPLTLSIEDDWRRAH